jgi:hypothetical protein
MHCPSARAVLHNGTAVVVMGVGVNLRKARKSPKLRSTSKFPPVRSSFSSQNSNEPQKMVEKTFKGVKVVDVHLPELD